MFGQCADLNFDFWDYNPGKDCAMIFRTFLLICACAALSASPSLAFGIHSSVSQSDVPELKRTSLDLYLTSHDAHDVLVQEPNVLFIDVRDPIEVSRFGHPAFVDAILSVKVQSDRFDPNLEEFALIDNPEFLRKMRALLAKTGKSRHDMIIVTCGSGVRSAQATEKLIKAGFTNVWHITDGYPGDEKPGFNTHNAWELEGLPWSYDVVPGSSWIRVIAPD